MGVRSVAIKLWWNHRLYYYHHHHVPYFPHLRPLPWRRPSSLHQLLGALSPAHQLTLASECPRALSVPSPRKKAFSDATLAMAAHLTSSTERSAAVLDARRRTDSENKHAKPNSVAHTIALSRIQDRFRAVTGFWHVGVAMVGLQQNVELCNL